MHKILPDGHGAEDVEEDEAAISHVISQQVSVAQPLKQSNLSKLANQIDRILSRYLDPVDWGERELCNDSAVKDGVEHGEESSECKSWTFHDLLLCFNDNNPQPSTS